MDDDEFDAELDDYLNGRSPNWETAAAEVVWVDDDPAFGSLHIAAHGVTPAEVEEVLFEVPPAVEAKRHPDHPGRTIFWGATRAGRWLFVACEDWTTAGQRHLKPITAFEPDDGRAYWDDQ